MDIREIIDQTEYSSTPSQMRHHRMKRPTRPQPQSYHFHTSDHSSFPIISPPLPSSYSFSSPSLSHVQPSLPNPSFSIPSPSIPTPQLPLPPISTLPNISYPTMPSIQSSSLVYSVPSNTFITSPSIPINPPMPNITQLSSPNLKVNNSSPSHIPPSSPIQPQSQPQPSTSPKQSPKQSLKSRSPPPIIQKPPKRPRVIASSATTSHRKELHSTLVDPTKNIPSTVNSCAFCGIPGSRPECEGQLLGPFRLPNKIANSPRTFYAHSNCAIWAPEVYEATNGRLKDVHHALLRARKRKCLSCGNKGASLACMHRNNACCRPMHFRCALLDEACLREGFKTYCPHHTKSGALPSDLNEDRDAYYLDRTPVSQDLLIEGKGCTMCDKSVYDASLGPILTCAGCCERQHATCVFPKLECVGPIAAYAHEGNYLCKRCMKCNKCNLSVDSEVYQANHDKQQMNELHHVFDDANEQEAECSAVTCVSCGHFAIHTACVEDKESPTRWRCDPCHICRHCDTVNVPRAKWNERHEACPDCAKEIREGGVICPVCEKVYREGENIPMVQCDYCDKWIHAKDCGKLSDKEFKQMGTSDSKYRCPICTTDKKRREQERRKAKGGNVSEHGGKKKREDISSSIAELVQRSTQYEEDASFHAVRKAATQGRSFSQVLNDLAIETEICRHCCSSGPDSGMLFCADCGECYHRYCHEWKKALPDEKGNPSSRNGFTLPLCSGNLGVDASAWLCVQCQTFSNLLPDCTNAEEKLEIERLTPDDRTAQDSGESGSGYDSIPRQHQNTCTTNLTSPIEVSSSSEASVLSYNAITWPDNRLCVLCERPEDHATADGRLIPWASSSSDDFSHYWVHIHCAMWSVAVSVHGSTTQCDTLIGPRRAVISLAKRSVCHFCKRVGATLMCSHQNCKEAYHFHCARETGVECEVNWIRKGLSAVMNLLSRPSQGSVNLVNVSSLKILCPSHKNSHNAETGSTVFLEDVQSLLNLDRVVRIADSTGFSPDADPPTRKPVSSDRFLSVRIGSISVLRFGRLVPEVNDFIVNGCLIPLGYCAAKRFWSMVNPGYRCLYFFEVLGSPNSGPRFVIRCSDCSTMKIEDKDPEKAWSVVVGNIKQLRKKSGLTDPRHGNMRIKGLEAFGLQNCVQIVTQIESLPMAAMFKGRYMLKRVAPRKEKDIIFYDSLAQRYKPSEMTSTATGSARAEGFLPKIHTLKYFPDSNSCPPAYGHKESGNSFQLNVVKDFFAAKRANRTGKCESIEDEAEVKSSIFLSGASRSNVGTENRRSESSDSLLLKKRPKCLAPEASNRTIILRSEIDGWGVFATKDIPVGELITEYVGELIRPALSDIRERKYVDKGIGCYMFEIEPGVIVDATMKGNIARYINHSCGPNCHSKTITGENGEKIVAIFAKRRIQRGEELSYDYQFPFDDQDRVKCGCRSAECKGWMN